MSVKDTALHKVEHGKTLLVGRWRNFREESPYFQAKVGLVTAWVLLSLLTLWLVPPTPLPFVVEQKMINFGLAEKTTLIILNQGGGDLDAAVVEVSGTMTDFDGKQTTGHWATKAIAIPQGLKTTLSTESLFDAKGANPGYQLQIGRVVITEDGDEVWSGPAAAPAPR